MDWDDLREEIESSLLRIEAELNATRERALKDIEAAKNDEMLKALQSLAGQVAGFNTRLAAIETKLGEDDA